MKLSYSGLTQLCLSGRQVTLSVAAVTAKSETVEPVPDLGLYFYYFTSEHLNRHGCC